MIILGSISEDKEPETLNKGDDNINSNINRNSLHLFSWVLCVY